MELGERFTLIVDESKNIRKTVQISVISRYLNSGDVHEAFLDLTPPNSLDAESLHMTIRQTLAKYKIDKNTCSACVMMEHL